MTLPTAGGFRLVVGETKPFRSIRSMERRRFLGGTVAVTGAVMLSQCGARPRDRQPQNLKDSGPRPWERLRSQDGQLEATLTAQATTVTLANRNAQLLAYNGQVPGPILEVRPGDRVRLHLVNQLDQPTNLHFHGLHISPEIDNVFRAVAAGDRFTYEFQIPPDHPAVTAWYHPHHHGHVAEQVFGGLAGVLLVRGDLDEIPEIQQAAEALLVLQDFELTDQGDRATPQMMAQMWGREGHLRTVSGQLQPAFQLPQNGLLRLRLVNASASRIYQLQLQDHPWFLIATDRGAIAQPTPVGPLRLAPGERAELLVPGNGIPGSYKLLSLPYDRGLFGMMGAMQDRGPMGQGRHREMSGIAALMEPEVVAMIHYQVSDRSTALGLPQTLIEVAALPEPVRSRSFILDHGIAPMGGAGFLINGQAFQADRIDVSARLGDVEDWKIINRASMDHPFHLHVNPFQVIQRNGQPEVLRAWKDTVDIGAYEEVIIRVQFRNFPGKTVYHCHILDHEDRGMMGIIQMNA